MSETTLAELDIALDRASAAASALAGAPLASRASMLRGLADKIDAAVGDLVPLAERETNLPATRLAGEVTRTTDQLRFMADVVMDGSWLDAAIDLADPDAPAPLLDMRTLNVPIGVALIFAASNFPFAFSVAGGDTASALAAGCPVIVKSHPGHPELSARVGALVTDVFGGGFALIDGVDAGRRAIGDPRVKVAAFTGSVAGGRTLMDLATARDDPIPFYGELGSVNPAIVSAGAARQRGPEIAAGFVASFTLGVGQFCTKPGMLLIPAGTDMLAYTVSAASEAGMGALLGNWVHDRHAALLRELSAVSGVRVAFGGTVGHPPLAGPTVLATTASALLHGPHQLVEECFGPTALVVEYHDAHEVVAVCEAIGGTLAASIHADPGESASLGSIVAALERIAGRLVWNGWTTGVRVGWATHHGGPWPCSTAVSSTSVGATAIRRFVRPIAYQNVPQALLPPALRDRNETHIPRRVDGTMTTADVRERQR